MRIVFAGGGTGGHIYPAVAIAKAVAAIRPDAEILFIGAERGMETQLVPQEGFRLKTVNVTGLSRSNPLQAARSVWQAGQGLLRADKIIRTFRPDVAVGTGGYVSGPALLAAARLGVPTMIHEQNAFPGLTTRMLSRFARLVAVSHEEARARLPHARQIIVTGMPIRSEFYRVDRMQARAKLGIAADAIVVLSVGGSGGALRLNEAVVESMPATLQNERLLFMQVTGERYFEHVTKLKESAALPDLVRNRWQVIRFLYDMPAALAAADLVISRAGASTMEEITAVGVPAILIPSPNVTDNHQEHNANSLARKGGAVILRDELLTATTLNSSIEALLLDKPRLLEMAKASKLASHPQATAELCQLVMRLAKA